MGAQMRPSAPNMRLKGAQEEAKRRPRAFARHSRSAQERPIYPQETPKKGWEIRNHLQNRARRGPERVPDAFGEHVADLCWQKAFSKARKAREALAKHNQKKLQELGGARIASTPAGAGILPSSLFATHGGKRKPFAKSLKKETKAMKKKIDEELELRIKIDEELKKLTQDSVGGQGGGGKQYRRTTKKSRMSLRI